MAEGDIGSVTDSLEFDDTLGDAPSIVHVSGTVFAIAYEGDLSGSYNNGRIKTVTITALGAIAFVSGGTETFEAVRCNDAHIIHITGNVYAVVYKGVGGTGFVKTVTISPDGATVTLTAYSLEFNTTLCDNPRLIRIASGVYAIVYAGAGWNGTITPITINASGEIAFITGEEEIFESGQAKRCKIIPVADNVFVIAYQDANFKGQIKTVTITSAGITGVVSGGGLTFDDSNGHYANMIYIAGNVYAVVYTDGADDGWCRTITIDTDGAPVVLTAENIEFDNTYGTFPEISHVSGEVYAIAYKETANDGRIKTIAIASDGAISWKDETGLEFDLDCAMVGALLHITGNVYAIVYSGLGLHGWIKTIDIETRTPGGVMHLMTTGIG